MNEISIKNYLQDLDENFRSIKVENFISAVKDGVYNATIIDASIKMSKWDKLQLVWGFRLDDGRKIFKYMPFALPKKNNQSVLKEPLYYIKRDLITCGLIQEENQHLTNISSLSLHEAVGKKVEIKVINNTYVYNGENKSKLNIYINRLIENGEVKNTDINNIDYSDIDSDIPF